MRGVEIARAGHETTIRPDGQHQHTGSTEERRLILYVDDDESNREVLELCLRSQFDIILAANDREAIQALCTHGDRLYAILLDIQLQGSLLDGIRLAKLIRANLPAGEKPPFAQSLRPLSVPIIFITAYSIRYSERELKLAGGDVIVGKPIDFKALSTALDRCRRDPPDRLIA